MAICFPSLEQVSNYRVPLTAGEKYFLEALCLYLDDSYEIYIQPFLNGDRPDFLIMRKNYGVFIVEVKDWNLDHYGFSDDPCHSWFLVKDKTKIKSPLAQAQSYKENLYNIHLNELFERNIKNKKNFSIVQVGVYFHNSTASKIKEFLRQPKFIQLLGIDDLNEVDIANILKRSNNFFDDELYSKFRRFFNPPNHNPDEGEEIKYTPKQMDLVQSKGNYRQKIRGIAGCGKTKVLAGRAVNAYARTGKTVLILTFNITIRNYIHDCISKVRLPFPWSGFEITHYHQFVKTQANNYGLICDEKSFDDEIFFNSVEESINRYSVILVDEVQDYKHEWLRVLIKNFLEEDGEFVVFGDEKQNIYARPLGDDRFPIIPSISGRWNELNTSFRLKDEIFRISQLFQKKYFAGRYQLDIDIELYQQDLLEYSLGGKMIYKNFTINFNSTEAVGMLVRCVEKLKIHPNDLVVVSLTYDVLRDFEYKYRMITRERTTISGETMEEYVEITKRYNNQEDIKLELENVRRGRKIHFWGNAGTAKFSTIHSFKGWEADTLVLILDDLDKVRSQGGYLDELIYVALTRARKNLIIFDFVGGEYKEFFSRVI
jgi:hypothetical protein